MGNRVLLVLAGLGLAGVGSWFALGGDEVAKWNDRTVALCSEFHAHAQEFAPTLKPWAAGDRMDVGSFKPIDDGFAVFSRKMRESAERVKAERPPDDPLCKQFHAAVVDFAELQVQQLVAWSGVVDLMRKYNQPSPGEIREVLSRIDLMGAETGVLLNRANQKQRVMAEKFKLKVR